MTAPQSVSPLISAPCPPGHISKVNLLPESLRRRWIRQRRRRWWSAALAAAALLSGVGWQAERRLAQEVRQARAVLAETAGQIRFEEQQAAVLAARADDLRKRRAVLDAMRAADSWARRLGDLAAAVPEQVVLTRIHLVPAANRPAAKEASAGAPPFELRIEGYATNHQALAQFMRRLQERPAYADVSLVKSATQSLGSAETLAFDLACRR